MVLATYYELLKDYISFKTIHDTTTFATEAEKAVKRIANLLTKNHFEVKEYNVDDTPILIAKFVQNKNLPTALIYTNYDLQLQEISSDWKNNPFNLYLGKEEIIGRGVAESKGQFVIYLATILNLLQNDQLGYNITFLIDGTQHKIGTTLTEFLQLHRMELQSDFCCCSTGNGRGLHPTVEVGQRGSINFDIVLSTTPETGTTTALGGGQPQNGGANPTLEMAKLLTKLYNVNKIAIPYFYYNVEKAKQEIEIRRYGTNLEYKTITKSPYKNPTILEPTLDITGIISFPKFEKSKIPPKKTIANLHMHIVNNQNYQEIINGLQQWLKLTVPPTLKTELTIHEAFNPCKFNIQSSATQKAIALLSGAFKTTVEYQQNPHGLKVAETLQKSVCPTIISLPFADEQSNIGQANENLKIETVKKVFDFCMAFFGK